MRPGRRSFSGGSVPSNLSYKDAIELNPDTIVEVSGAHPPKYEFSLKESEESSPASVMVSEGESEVIEPAILSSRISSRESLAKTEFPPTG